MPFEFDPPETDELRQGEIIGPVVELRVAHPAIDIPTGVVPVVDSIAHRLMIVVSADCDLLRDFLERQAAEAARRPPNLLRHVLLCDAYSPDEIANAWPSGFNTNDRRHARQNQNERYHCFPKARIRGSATEIEATHMDLKNVLSIPPSALYEGIAAGAIVRHACVAPVFLQDFTHRLYGFLSRVGPDFE